MRFRSSYKITARFGGGSRAIIGFLFVILVTGIALNGSWAAPVANFTIEISPLPECNDGIDNDNDGFTDFPNDPHCSSQSDNREAAGGGGSTSSVPLPSSATFTGRACSGCKVILLKGGFRAAETFAGLDGGFSLAFMPLTGGGHIFSFYAQDQANRRSSLLTVPLNVIHGTDMAVNNIIVPPTIELNKSEVKQGSKVSVLGRSVPDSHIEVVIDLDEENSVQTLSDERGLYVYLIDTSTMEPGECQVQSRVILNRESSTYSRMVDFQVGHKNVRQKGEESRGDLNDDGQINLVDFSIIAHWYRQPLSVELAQYETLWLSGDGVIDLVDLSILAYNWTG